MTLKFLILGKCLVIYGKIVLMVDWSESFKFKVTSFTRDHVMELSEYVASLFLIFFVQSWSIRNDVT